MAPQAKIDHMQVTGSHAQSWTHRYQAMYVEQIILHRPAAVIVNAAPAPFGVKLPGLGVHVLGGAVVPAAQLNATALAYPFAGVNFPLKVAFWSETRSASDSVMVIW